MKADWEIKTLGEILQKTETINPLQLPETEFNYVDVSVVRVVVIHFEHKRVKAIIGMQVEPSASRE